METMRRFLVLTPVALGVSAVTFLILYGVAGTGSVGLLEISIALLLALVAAAVVLAVILVAVGVLRLFAVRNAWAALGLAFGLVAVVLGIIYVGIAASMQSNDTFSNMIFLLPAAGVQVPTWLTFAVGLLVGDRRNRAARDGTTVNPTA